VVFGAVAVRQMRHALRKDLNQRDVVKALEDIGASVKPLHQPLDLLIGFRGHTYLFEVKRPDKKGWKSEYTPQQIKFRQTWRGQMATVYTAEEAVYVLLELSN